MQRFYCKGMTLVELMITIAIVGILASIAYPSYTDYVVRSNRTEAQRELLRIASLQEQYYVDARQYTSDLKSLGFNNTTFTTESGNYVISAVANNVTGTFTLSATAQGSQASSDTACKIMTLTEVGEKSPAANCWE